MNILQVLQFQHIFRQFFFIYYWPSCQYVLFWKYTYSNICNFFKQICNVDKRTIQDLFLMKIQTHIFISLHTVFVWIKQNSELCWPLGGSVHWKIETGLQNHIWCKLQVLLGFGLVPPWKSHLMSMCIFLVIKMHLFILFCQECLIAQHD